MGGDHTDVAEVIEIIKFTIAPGLESEDFEVRDLREDSAGELQFALSIAFIHPNGCGGVNGQQRIKISVAALERVKMAAMIAVRDDLIELLEFFSQADDVAAH